jgi:alanyl-tRNA synthetase
MTSAEIRNSFLNFFRDRGHTIVPSSSVVPYDDPTLLFTNAGMNQFKDVFLGAGKRSFTRSADTQKCIRVSGKHNDLEEVGRDTYHHTFFEMLGNWSFGDYYKKEAIEWAWELLTNVWELPKSRLWATVYKDDDEAERYWKTVTDINPSHVLKFGEKDNFWEMGETGPCGPCSEIHIDRTPDGTATASLVNAGLPRLMEIWNLVFIQYNRDDTGKLTPLPAKHVDTGMGFERVCAVLQAKDSNYDTDVFSPIIRRICELTGKTYDGSLRPDLNRQQSETDTAMRVIADHIRTLTFAIGDGALPSNEGRGYVLRRILRRAARFGRNLDMREPFIYRLVPILVDSMSYIFPEIKTNQEQIQKVIQGEEEGFNATLDNGLKIFDEAVINAVDARLGAEGYLLVNDIDGRQIVKLPEGTYENSTIVAMPKVDLDNVVAIIPSAGWSAELNHLVKSPPCIFGHDAFKLYDTYGFPLDLTQLMAEERGLKVDISSFEEFMSRQKRRSREAREAGIVEFLKSYGVKDEEINKSEGIEAKFVGYEKDEEESTIYGGGPNTLLIHATPFYAEAGGQVGDKGVIEGEGFKFKVEETKRDGPLIVHYGVHNRQYIHGEFNGLKVEARIDRDRRRFIERNHSATHLVHEALRRVLGTHLHQQGSLVAPDHLRFDFNHYQRISPEQLKEIEDIVNQKILDGIAVASENDPTKWMTIDEAKKKWKNVKMFFGEKYGERVRVVEIDPNFSVELCGGTHVKSTSEIGFFKFRSEGSIASGIRRIEAVTGDFALELLKLQEKSIVERIDYAGDQLGKIKELLTKVQYANAQAVPAGSDLLPTFARTLDKLKSTFDRPGKVSMELRTYFERHAVVGREVENLVLRLADMLKALEKEVGRNRLQTLSSDIEGLVAHAVSINGFKLVATKVQSASVDELKSLGDSLRAKLGSGVGLIASIIDDKVSLVCVVTDDLVAGKKIEAGKIVGAVARLVGGGGGGRPHMATAGGRDIAKLDEAISQTKSIVESFLHK